MDMGKVTPPVVGTLVGSPANKTAALREKTDQNLVGGGFHPERGPQANILEKPRKSQENL